MVILIDSQNNLFIFLATQLEQGNTMEMNWEDSEYLVRVYLEDGKYAEAFIICHTFEGKMKGMKESRKDLNLDEQVEFYVTLLHGIYSDIKSHAIELFNAEIHQNGTQQTEAEAVENRISYLEDVVKFLQVLHDAIPNLLEMLESSTLSDVTEAIDFFVMAYQFELKDSVRGLEGTYYLI